MSPFVLFIVAFVLETGVSAIQVTLSDNGPAVRGANVTFTATIVSGYTGENFKFVFTDNGVPQHKQEIMSTNQSVNYIVEYFRNTYEAGQYNVHLEVKRNYFDNLWWTVATAFTAFNLTDTLHGDMILSQNEGKRPNNFVAVNKVVTHFVQLEESELQFLEKNSSSILTHWFIDCNYIDTTSGFSLNYTYEDNMGAHEIEAIVVANNKPLPPITSTTTSTTTTTTSTTTTTTTTTTPKPHNTTVDPTTTIVPNKTVVSTTIVPSTTLLPTSTTPKNVSNVDDTSGHKISKRAISNRTTMKGVDGEIATCKNTIPIGKGYTYGRYQHTIFVREPISTINITGLNWLQHGDLLNLNVKYTGSAPFSYCIQYKVGQYNVTGNETCPDKSKIKTIATSFPLIHYFSDSDVHTVVVVIENDIGKNVAMSTINIYKVSVHAQLSVIVIPVFFCLVAVILVVFGIAYYQHRSRHSVEVADFDFGQAHLDYKTFTERLRESFSSAFNFRQRDDTDPLTNNTRYDSMT